MVDPAWPAPRSLPEQAQGEVQVWLFDTEGVAPETRAALFSLLSPDEVVRTNGYRHERDRRAFASRRGALRALLGGYAGMGPADLEFALGPQGKPCLAARHRCDLGFSVARSAGLALIAVARGIRVGVDLERIRPIAEMDGIMARGAAVERERWAALAPDGRPTAFLRWWTLKEAYLKATGQGLTAALDGFAVEYAELDRARLLWVRGDVDAPGRWTMRPLAPSPGCLGAVACEGAATIEPFELGGMLLEHLLGRSG